MSTVAADIQALRDVFEANADPENAEAMSAYMKNRYVFHGLKAPKRKALAKDFIEANLVDRKLNEDLVMELWEQEEREYQMVALDYLPKTHRSWKRTDLRLFKRLIQSKSWWDSVDALASTMVGGLLAKFPELRVEMEDWNRSEDFWLVRTSIIYQLKYRDQVDFKQLKKFILAHSASTEFFINKASGWALRQYSKFEPEIVGRFIEETDLPKLTVREGSKYL